MMLEFEWVGVGALIPGMHEKKHRLNFRLSFVKTLGFIIFTGSRHSEREDVYIEGTGPQTAACLMPFDLRKRNLVELDFKIRSVTSPSTLASPCKTSTRAFN